MRVREALKKSMSSAENIALSRLPSTLLARRDFKGFSGGEGRIGREAGRTLRSGTIGSLALGLRTLLRWRIGRLRMKIAKMISRGERDEYSKWSCTRKNPRSRGS